MVLTRQTLMLLLTTVMLLASGASAQFLKNILGTTTKTEDGDADVKMQQVLGEYHGLKHAVGVVRFENEAGYASEWDLGNNLGIMLESALVDCGRFVVLERENLDLVMAEQDLQASGRTANAKKVAQTGKLRSARYLATGAITEVEVNQSGGDGGLRIKGFTVGASGGRAQITTIVKLIDTSSGEIVAKQRVVGKAGRKGLRVGFADSNFGVDLGGFIKTPLGEAAQDVINQAVIFFAKEMEDYDFSGSVVMVSGAGDIIINRGTQYGVAPGQRFVVTSEGEQLIDPDTGEILGQSAGRVIARIECTKATEKVAYCKLIEGENPDRGAVVKAN